MTVCSKKECGEDDVIDESDMVKTMALSQSNKSYLSSDQIPALLVLVYGAYAGPYAFVDMDDINGTSICYTFALHIFSFISLLEIL